MDMPDTNPKTRFGRAKPPVHAIPPVALLHLGAGMENGEEKYGLTNWREHQVSASVYYDAAMRHFMSWWDGERVASDSKVHHLGHVMACCAILLDAEEQGMLNDDRPSVPGAFAEVVERMRLERIARAEAAANPVKPDHWAAGLVNSQAEAETLDRVVDGEIPRPDTEDALRSITMGTAIRFLGHPDRENRKEVVRAALRDVGASKITDIEGIGNLVHVLAQMDFISQKQETQRWAEEARKLSFSARDARQEEDQDGDDEENDDDEDDSWAEKEVPPRVAAIPEVRTQIDVTALAEKIGAYMVARTDPGALTRMKERIGCFVPSQMDQEQRTRLAFYLDLASEGFDWDFDKADEYIKSEGQWD